MMTTQPTDPSELPEESRRERELREIREALRGLRYGSVHVIVQDGVIVQIERTEKHRLPRSRSKT